MAKLDFLTEYESAMQKVARLTQATNKRSVLIVTQYPVGGDNLGFVSSIRESVANIVCIISVSDGAWARQIVPMSVGIIDYLVIDHDSVRPNSHQIVDAFEAAALVSHLRYSFFSDFDTWASAGLNYVEFVVGNILRSGTVLLVGKNPLATRIITKMVSVGREIVLLSEEYQDQVFPNSLDSSCSIQSSHIKYCSASDLEGSDVDIVLGCSIHQNSGFLNQLSGCRIRYAFDIGIKNFTEEFALHHQSKGTRFFRSDDRAATASAVYGIMETDYLVKNHLGSVTFGGIEVVSGGAFGAKGAIVVDDYRNPTAVLGVANGDGSFKQDLTEKDIEGINKIKMLL